MKVTSFLPVLVGAQLGLAAMAFAAPGDNLSRVRGSVTKVDAAAKTITVSDRRTQSETTFSVNRDTKYRVAVKGSLSDIKVGDNVRVMGQENGNSVDAQMIAVVPQAPAGNRPGGRPGRGISGVVLSTTPSLTVKTADNQTDTINTTTDTNVMTSRPGAFSDVEVGKSVTATLDSSTSPSVAKEVQVQPAWGGRGPGGGRAGN